ncbi:MAG: lipoprotein NlpI [Parashewanella sp.]
MKSNLRFLLTLGCLSVLTACTSLSSSNQSQLLVAPLSPAYQTELEIAKSTDILARAKLKKNERARLHYGRGVLYDKVGLRLLARYDFRQALKFEPKLADAYNFLGIYATIEGDYDSAYEAFGSVLELAPDYDYALLNRGIAAYYGQRINLAVSDLQRFYLVSPEDGYRSLWLYLAEQKNSPEAALMTLNEHRQQLDDNEWSSTLVDFYLGKYSETELLEKAKQDLPNKHSQKVYTERLCEAYFYLGKQAQFLGNNRQAENWFRLALATDIFDFIEYRFASVELAALESQN